ncbi:Serpentine Receptor, class E (Epsilon) [Caenorhabditis elegans]|uniref:Serpentine Receptor, class E (Epsilon) n=1 Tax=Caenorhabditis elegans TaxID=6239 RepID=Q9XUK3_CAEEL|nr:Serpentine Receptor, class E (Epsilon) [Caenorhabditis elegans]CAB04934.1 Serpentine Receptor, class E (Epsilon) [Caenorhabditis elegans]|eukprot:NP_496918.1 Serpentine Receptor, class E (epsilon) [Caenorhabditis elegans]
MIFLIGNSSYFRVLTPTTVLHDHRLRGFPDNIYLIVYGIFHLLIMYFVLKCAYICLKIRVFHWNLTCLIFSCSVQWFETFIGSLMILPYESGYWILGESNITIQQGWTDIESEMIKVPNFFNLFFLGSFLKFHYILSMGTTGLLLAVERTFACYYLTDYEKKPRIHLVVILIIGHQTFNFISAILHFFQILQNLVYIVLIALIPNVVSSVIFAVTENYNQKVTKTIENFANPNNYTLAARYQAKENVKCFAMIKKVIFAGIGMIFISCSSILLIYFDVFPNHVDLLNFVFEASLNVGPSFIGPTLIHSVDAWRNYELCPFSNKIVAVARKTTIVKVVPVECDKDSELRKETDTYFRQLNNSWS